MAIRALAVELSPWKARLAGGPSFLPSAMSLFVSFGNSELDHVELFRLIVDSSRTCTVFDVR